MKNAIAIVALSLMLSACGSTGGLFKSSTEKAEDARQADVQNSKRAVMPSTVISTIPEWYNKSPEVSETIHVAGTAFSRDMGMAVEKATLDAQFKAAGFINANMSGLVKQYTSDTHVEFGQNTTKVIEKMIAEVKVGGHFVSQQVIYPEGGGFRVYVQLQFNANRLMAQAAEGVIPQREQNAHRELNDRVVNLKQEANAANQYVAPRSAVAPGQAPVVVTPLPAEKPAQ